MCYEVRCSSCGKTSWEGCGNHVPSVYKRIPEGQHCLCKEWPGINPPKHNQNPTGDASESFSYCTIL